MESARDRSSREVTVRDVWSGILATKPNVATYILDVIGLDNN